MHSPRWIAGPVEQRFTRCELDEARSRGMGFGAWSLFSQEALASVEEGGSLFGGGRRLSLRWKKDALASTGGRRHSF